MQEFTYRPQNVCSTKIELKIDEDILIRVSFQSGCEGNLEGISRLVEGMPIAEVIKRLRGIRCEQKQTSCPDQLAKALEAFIQAK